MANLFKKTLRIIGSLSKKTIFNISLFGVLASSVFLFLSGTINPNSILSDYASYLSEVAKSDISKNGYVSFQITAINEKNESNYPSTYNEYFYWKYIFRHSNFSFLSTVNGGKTHNCFYKEINSKDNVTFLYSGNNSNPKYNDYYKHEIYDIFFMFKGNNRMVSDALNFFAISETKAQQLLSVRGVQAGNEGYSSDQYETLLGTNTVINIDGEDFLFTISNVYFENGEMFQNVNSTFGEFAVSYIHFPPSLQKECTYMFNKYEYQNLHKIKRIRNAFSSDEYKLSLSSFNLNSIEKLNVSKIYNILNSNLGNNALSIVLTIFSIVLFAASVFLFFAILDSNKLLDYVVFFSLFLIPYGSLGVINIFMRMPLLFSYHSLTIFAIELLIVIAWLLFKLFTRGFLNREKGN